MGMVRSARLAWHMGFSKPSISHAVGVLKGGGFLAVDGEGYLHLTDAGKEVAEKIYERHCVLTAGLINMGANPEQAERDACKIEHVVSDESFQKLRESFRKME